MWRLAIVLLPLCLAVSGGLSGETPPFEGKRTLITLNGQQFSLPPGFVIERVAGPPLVNRPITADFDEQGRLYVADSSGSNEKVNLQLEKKPHRIVRLEDTNGDGVFDRSVVFADKMMFPEGTMWYAGSLYVAAPPSIWKLTDTNGDGVADQRAEWFQGKTLTGCANDLHGPYRGPDGWIYWCKGAFARQTYDRPGKAPFVTRAAHIFRARPDGTGIEPVMTGGMDNPVDVVFSPGGERFFTTTFLQHPGGGKRDGLIHAVHGAVYGKDHDPVHEHPWTAPSLMPPMTHLGPAAPCGLTRYEGTAFGADHENNLFACLFNMHKVTRHVLVPTGATYTTRDEDFVVSNSLDFHPTDVIEDADGSLLVIDTGGWYKLCCPTSQLVKPDVLGGIYRIRKKGAPRPVDPRGLQIPWSKMGAADLVRLLDDPRPVVRRRAIEKLATPGTDAVADLSAVVRDGKSAQARRNAVWTLTRIESDTARSAVRRALNDQDATVRQAALHSISLWRDSKVSETLIKRLGVRSPLEQRLAAEALGRIGAQTAVPALLSAMGEARDRFLEHALIYALIEIGDRNGTAKALATTNPRVRRAALIALDQMPGGKLDPAVVARELNASDPTLKETASWLVGLHPEWGPALAEVLGKRLHARTLTAPEREELTQHLARLSRTPAIQSLLAEAIRQPRDEPEVCRTALRAMAQAGLKQTPAEWINGVTGVLGSGREDLLGDALLAARAFPVSKSPSQKLSTALLAIGNNERLAAELRLRALAAVPGGVPDVSPALLRFLVEQLDARQAVVARALSADTLAQARLTSSQLATLAEALRTVSPMEMNRVLEAFGQSGDSGVGHRLVTGLKSAPAFSSVRSEALKKRLSKYGPPVQKELHELLARLNVDQAKQKAKLEQMLGSLGTGDVRRGQILFNSSKAACSACHAIGYLGGKVGPDLTRIGQIRTERDLLESIILPSASIAQGFEPLSVTTRKGKTYNGLLRKNVPDEIVLVISATEEVRIPREDIDELQPSRISVMPAGLEQQISRQDLADLIAFLKACR